MSIFVEKKDEILDLIYEVMEKAKQAPTMKLAKEVIITRDLAYVAWLNERLPSDFGLDDEENALYKAFDTPYERSVYPESYYMPNGQWNNFITMYESDTCMSMLDQTKHISQMRVQVEKVRFYMALYDYFRDYFEEFHKGIGAFGDWAEKIWESLVNIKLSGQENENEFYKIMMPIFEAGGIPCGWEFEDISNPPPEIDRDLVATQGLQGRKLVVYWPHEQDPEFV